MADATGSYRLVWFIALALGLVAAALHLIIDDGPAPEAPVAAEAGGIGLAPAGAAAVAIIAGVGALTATTRDAAAADRATDAAATATHAAVEPAGGTGRFFCGVHLS